ncbi:MAG: hypothetical protein M0R80_13330 [Proteobacteria bacterium]|jgi:hypothetical protein|nr:hypothetical protein [Pseudomonadota bacterium]
MFTVHIEVIGSPFGKIIQKLQEYKAPFELTGSHRYLRKVNADWDFFTQYNNNIYLYLLRIGFVSCLDYQVDRHIKSVLIWNKGIDVNEQIHIQLVSDFQAKVIIQNYFGYEIHQVNDKTKANNLWNSAFRLYYNLKGLKP